jgi:hypothetical protein
MSDLPPLHDDIAYVVVAENDQRGPYQLEVLITEVLGGRIHDSTPIWWPGLAEWTTIAGHPGLAEEIQRRRDAYAASNPVVPPPVPTLPPAEPAPQPVQADSNLGMFGVDRFDAILPPGTGAILAVAASRPVVVALKDGSIAVRRQMQVNLTCDHRVIYGADAAAFLKDLASLIENRPETLAF